jgi:hypothetical protein
MLPSAWSEMLLVQVVQKMSTDDENDDCYGDFVHGIELDIYTIFNVYKISDAYPYSALFYIGASPILEVGGPVDAAKLDYMRSQCNSKSSTRLQVVFLETPYLIRSALRGAMLRKLCQSTALPWRWP